MIHLPILAFISCLLWSPALVAQEKQAPKPSEQKSADQLLGKVMADRTMKRVLDDVIRQAGRGMLLKLPPAEPLKRNPVREALAEVQQAVQRAQHLADLKAVRKELDKAEKALMKARQELWKKVREQDKPKHRPKPTSKPTTKRTQTDGARRSASGRDRR